MLLLSPMVDLMIDNSDKTAMVYGVRNDLSLAFAVALELQSSGAMVALSYTKDTKDDVLALAEENKFNLDLCAEVDIRNEEQIAQFVQKVAASQAIKKVDYVLHGTAFASPRVIQTNYSGHADKEEWDYLNIPFEDLVDSFNVSAYSFLRVARASRPFLAPGASLLTLTHLASQKVFPSYGGMAINKAALETITRYLAHCFGADKIRVNAISCGVYSSTSALGIKGVRTLRSESRRLSFLGNIKSTDVANTALYYFSDLSTRVTGNIHFVDGGYNTLGSRI